MTDITWRDERRRLGDLVAWKRNPRRIQEAEARRLQESFEEFGQPELIAVGPGNEVYNGHQRLKAWTAKFGPDQVVHVRVASRALTEKEREKLTVYLHRGAVGEWDMDVLLREFDTSDLVKWGFDEDEVGIVPDFQPVDESEQPRLDQKAPITCPECGHEFVPG